MALHDSALQNFETPAVPALHPVPSPVRAPVRATASAPAHPRTLRRAPIRRAPIRRATVCIPAKNEAARLPATLHALADAAALAHAAGVTVDVVVALDGCTDNSRDVLRRISADYPARLRRVEIPAIGVPHAGRARRAAMEAGLSLHARDQALLTTDADTRVAKDWIVETAAALRHTDLVAGWVDWDTETAVDELMEQEHYFSDLHRLRRRLDPVPFDARDPHHKMYGASLGIRATAYRRIGGLPELPSSEDVAMTRAVRLAGLRMRQDRAVRVLTSTRRSGRAVGGFSDAILSDAARARRGEVQRVECPDTLARGYVRSARLRRAFERGDHAGARRIGNDIPDVEFDQAWAASSTGDAFVTRLLEPAPPAPRISLARARARVASLLEAAP